MQGGKLDKQQEKKKEREREIYVPNKGAEEDSKKRKN